MEFISWNNELGLANLLFERCFNNIRIERRNEKGEASWLKVRCVFGQRSRILKNLENETKRGTWKLPMIVISRSGYSRQGDRLNNLHNEVKFEVSQKNRDYQKLTPVPIDISYDVTVIAKKPGDIDKIASNFMVFFNSNIYVSQEHPKYAGVKLNNQIIMNDSVSEEHPAELGPEQDDIITSTFGFTFKTYLFGGCERYRKIPVSVPVSSHTETVTSSYIGVLQPDQIDMYQKLYPQNPVTAEIGAGEIDGFQRLFPNTPVSAELTCQVLSTVVDSQTSSVGEEYEGVPLIYKLDFGFYSVPKKESIEGYIESVDNGLVVQHEHFSPSAYLSSDVYIRTEDGVQTSGDHYAPVDEYCTLDPYVDRIRWRIDDASTSPFPDNVQPFRQDSDFR